jgi:NAD(P)-dependent dehydrogenase (short-subunit alcohol dehydrogenase family)
MATVLITGANRGIGLALAQTYHVRGDDVVVTVRTQEKSGPLFALDGDASFITLDVTNPASLKAAAATLAGRPIDVLICNAGANDARGGLDASANTMDTWTHLLTTNVAGVFFTVRAFAPNVIAAKGKIGIISSRMGSSSAAAGNSYAYRASKAAASNIAANLAIELKSQGVAVASFHPGWVKTDMGGAGADIDAATSAKGLIARLDALSLATTGAFENYDGTPIAY